jgi:hypothetical protein
MLALVCEDTSIVSILNRLGHRTGNGNTWTEKRVQHVRRTNGFPACPSPDQRLWITMQQAFQESSSATFLPPIREGLSVIH